MSVAPTESDSRDEVPASSPAADAGPLGALPLLAHRQVLLEERLTRLDPGDGPSGFLAGLADLIGEDAAAGRVEVLWRASGLRRPHLVAQLAWPRVATRLAFGLETPLAHALVDRLLGYDRLESEGRLQLTPVEWGILTFLVARGLARHRDDDRGGPLGPWDLMLDRVGPDPFDARGLGSIVTLRWPVRYGAVAGSVRLWLPEALVARWLTTDPRSVHLRDSPRLLRYGELAGEWHAEAGTVAMPRGLGRLRTGGVLPLTETRLAGSAQDPRGPVDLVLGSGRDGRYRFPAEPVPYSSGGRLTLTAPLQRIPSPREALALNPTPDPAPTAAPNPAVAPTDVPVTLVVELGRINLSLARVADLRPGDVLELGRHSREPVEMTSGGRLVARGELVQIDTELGVRVTNIFL